jgi:hypothetical protein
MFNIVKRRDFMLASDTATAQEAEQLLLARYGRDYIVVNRANIDPGQDQRITESSSVNYPEAIDWQ